ncbi:MAG: phenylalanine--tRNA ligase subunit alpha [Candidatus Nanosyncoccaceae bacterium]|jgi:phenylalanyl-tRNA synthetase alpha chain
MLRKVKLELLEQINKSPNPTAVLKSPKLADLYKQLAELPKNKKADFGRELNNMKHEIMAAIETRQSELDSAEVEPIDVTAPWAPNEVEPELFSSEVGSRHPITLELEQMMDIFTRMGFEAIESRQLDDDFHMFESLNFPEDHPARDSYDTFRTEEGFIPPAHTSTMQYRILTAGREKLERGEAIAGVSYGRVYRNEDLDATHEHTFYQSEGVYVSETASLGEMLGFLQSFFESYFGQKLKIRTQPAYFPFTEPSLEFMIEKPKAIGGKSGDWLEVMGCGMIHPNVLEMAGIDSNKYRGFAWGGGIERLIMLKRGIDDVRYFESGKLEFLRRMA